MLVFVLLSVLHRCICVDLTYYVQEGLSPGTYLGNIAADSHLLDAVRSKDRDLITFSLLQQGLVGSSQLFKVSKKSGKFYTTQRLDAEALCTYNTECYEMVDIAVRRAESFMKILEIKVIIQDVNDHKPEFPKKQVNLTFLDGDRKGMIKSIPNAIDSDVGLLNSQIDYQLMKKVNEPFSLAVSKRIDGTSKLGIQLEEDLDREAKDAYMIHVIAKDRGTPPKQSVLDVLISVTDVNDNPPIFSQNVYNVTVKNEPSEISPIVILSVNDLDSTKYGLVQYEFSSKTPDIAKKHFQLNKKSGEIFLQRKFSFGQTLTHKLYVEAIDGGNPPLTSIAMVLVTVINEQNNPPKIDVNFVSASEGQTATISEDIKVGSFIAYVKVIDDDMGKNGEVNCGLQHEKFKLLKLDIKKYKVIVNRPVDREKEDHHDITIICEDKGSPPLRTERNFSVQVADVNDVYPRFAKKTFKFWIPENQKAKYLVGVINATDPDLGPGGKLTYSLVSKDKQFLPFRISKDGAISTIMLLDHEFQDIYRFKVLVEDNGTPSLNNTVNVIIEVTDENDNAPYFTFPSVNPYSLDVLYSQRHSDNITILKASDKDSLENAFLKYAIIRGNDEKIFKINRYTGLLSFNREVNQQDAGSHELEFLVKDSGIPMLSASTNISLVLTVSNLTSEMFNSTRTQLSERIHQYLLIVIVLVAVTLAVPITAGLSICCIRCNDHRKTPRNSGVKLAKKDSNQERHLIVHPHLSPAWPDRPGVRTADTNRASKSQAVRQKRSQSPGDKYGKAKKSSSLNMKSPKATDVIYQVCGFLSTLLNFLLYTVEPYYQWKIDSNTPTTHIYTDTYVYEYIHTQTVKYS